MILGLTGGYCAGKSEAAAILAGMGWICIDVDRLGHRALESSLPEVVKLLGSLAINPDGTPNRKAIGHLVFADKTLLDRFEALVHPAMFALTDKAIEDADGDRDGRVCLDAAILYRLPQAARCRLILEIQAPLLMRIQRGKARDGHSTLRILQRIVSQRSLKRYGSLYASKTIRVLNNGDKQKLAKDLKALVAKQTF